MIPVVAVLMLSVSFSVELLKLTFECYMAILYRYRMISKFDIFLLGSHVSHLENVEEEELNRLLGIVVDVENLFMCVHKEEDADTKQVYFYLFKVCFQISVIFTDNTVIYYLSIAQIQVQ